MKKSRSKEEKLKLIEDFKAVNAGKQMIKAGAFPHHRELSDFDFDFQPSINQQQIQDFCTLRFIENLENIVF